MKTANKIEKLLKDNKIEYNFMSSDGIITIKFFDVKKVDEIEDQVIDILRSEDTEFSFFSNEIQIRE